MLCAVGLVAAGCIALVRLPEQPPKPTMATITFLTYRVSYRYAPYILVSLRSEDGSTGRDVVGVGELTCRVGDVVPAEKVGAFLRLAGRACLRHHPRPGEPPPPFRLGPGPPLR